MLYKGWVGGYWCKLVTHMDSQNFETESGKGSEEPEKRSDQSQIAPTHLQDAAPVAVPLPTTATSVPAPPETITVGQLGECGALLQLSTKRNVISIPVAPNSSHQMNIMTKAARALIGHQQDVANLDYSRYGREAKAGEIQLLREPNVDNFCFLLPRVLERPDSGKWGKQPGVSAQKAAIARLLNDLQLEGRVDVGNEVMHGTFVDPSGKPQHKIRFRLAGLAMGKMQKYLVKTAGYSLKTAAQLMSALHGAEVHCPVLKATWHIELLDADFKVDHAGTMVVADTVAALKAAGQDAAWVPARGVVCVQTPLGESYQYDRLKRMMECGSVGGHDIGSGLHEIINAKHLDEYEFFQEERVKTQGWTRTEHRVRFQEFDRGTGSWVVNEAASALKDIKALEKWIEPLALAPEWTVGQNITGIHEHFKAFDAFLAGDKGEPCHPGFTHGDGTNAPSATVCVFDPSVQKVRRERGKAYLAERAKDGEVEPEVPRHLLYLSEGDKLCDFLKTPQFMYAYSQNSATEKLQGAWGRADVYSDDDGGFRACHEAIVTHTPNLVTYFAVVVKGGFEARFCKRPTDEGYASPSEPVTLVVCQLERSGPFRGMFAKWPTCDGLRVTKDGMQIKPPIKRPNVRREWGIMGVRAEELKHMRMADWPKASLMSCLRPRDSAYTVLRRNYRANLAHVMFAAKTMAKDQYERILKSNCKHVIDVIAPAPKRRVIRYTGTSPMGKPMHKFMKPGDASKPSNPKAPWAPARVRLQVHSVHKYNSGWAVRITGAGLLDDSWATLPSCYYPAVGNALKRGLIVYLVSDPTQRTYPLMANGKRSRRAHACVRIEEEVEEERA